MAVAQPPVGPVAHGSAGHPSAATVLAAGHPSAAAVAYAVAVALLAVLALAVAALAFTLAVEQLTESGVITLAPAAEPAALVAARGV